MGNNAEFAKLYRAMLTHCRLIVFTVTHNCMDIDSVDAIDYWCLARLKEQKCRDEHLQRLMKGGSAILHLSSPYICKFQLQST